MEIGRERKKALGALGSWLLSQERGDRLQGSQMNEGMLGYSSPRLGHALSVDPFLSSKGLSFIIESFPFKAWRRWKCFEFRIQIRIQRAAGVRPRIQSFEFKYRTRLEDLKIKRTAGRSIQRWKLCFRGTSRQDVTSRSRHIQDVIYT